MRIVWGNAWSQNRRGEIIVKGSGESGGLEVKGSYDRNYIG